MYFVAKSLKEMEEWLAACRHGKSLGRDNAPDHFVINTAKHVFHIPLVDLGVFR